MHRSLLLLPLLLLGAPAVADGPLEAGTTGEADWRPPLNLRTLPQPLVDGLEPDIQLIVNGTETDAFPGVVALVARSSQGDAIFCSGTLIDPDWVLTAGHCADALDNDLSGYTPYVAMGGDLMAGEVTELIRVIDWIIHPQYVATNSSIQNDVALLQLQSNAQTDPMVVNDEPVNSGWSSKIFTYVGFGITGDTKYDSGTKRTADIAFYSYDSQFIYAYDRNKNLCSGDSGGAGLEVVNGEYELAGVNSFVWTSPEFDSDTSTSCIGGASGAARVDQYISWIEQYTAVMTDASDGDADTDTDTDSDTDTDTDVDSDPGGEPSGDWDDPAQRPPEDAYIEGMLGCNALPVPPVGFALVLAGLIGIRRRRA